MKTHLIEKVPQVFFFKTI